MRSTAFTVLRHTLTVILVLALVGWGVHRWLGRPQGDAVAEEFSGAQLPPTMADATVLALGESAHGVADYRELLAQLTWKAAHEGMRTVVLEESAGGVSRVNEYIQGGPGSADDAVEHFGFRLSRTEKMRDFVEQLRIYNEGLPFEQRIHLYGMDIQNSEADRGRALDWLASIQAPEIDQLSESLKPVTRQLAWDAQQARDQGAHIDQLAGVVDAHARAIIDDPQHSSEERDAALRAQLSAQALQQAAAKATGDISRDEAMFNQLTAIQTYRHRAVVFAHAGHLDRIGAATSTPGETVGSLAAQKWGNDYQVIGIDALHTRTRDNDGVSTITVRAPLRGMFAGTKAGFVAFSDLSGDNAELAHREQPMHSTGSEVGLMVSLLPFFHTVTIVPAQSFDGYIYLDDTTAATRL